MVPGPTPSPLSKDDTLTGSSSAAPPPGEDAPAVSPRQPQAQQRSPLLLGALALAVVVVLLELGSYLLIVVSDRVLHRPVRRNAEVFAEQSLRIREIAARTDGQVLIDSVLGWRFRPGFRSGLDTINAAGLRSSREYAAVPADSVLRVAAFGDSFVYGSEVGNDSTWSAIAERHQPRLEIMNYGVGGYGDDQAYLLFLRAGTRHRARIAILGFVPDDLRRTVSIYRRFISNEEYPLFKPRFTLSDSNTLVLVPNPAPDMAAYLRYAEDPRAVRALGAHDQWYEGAIYANPLYDLSATVRIGAFAWTHLYRRYLDPQRLWNGEEMNRESDAFRIQAEIFAAFVRAADSLRLQPLIVFFPDRRSIERARAGQPTLYENLVAEVRRRRLPHLDAMSAFAERPREDLARWFAVGGHYSGSGNTVVALWLSDRLLAATRPR